VASIKLPKICVIGPQSAGKTSVLEVTEASLFYIRSSLGMNFVPSGMNLCIGKFWHLGILWPLGRGERSHRVFNSTITYL
jgi:hypothetical protein